MTTAEVLAAARRIVEQLEKQAAATATARDAFSDHAVLLLRALGRDQLVTAHVAFISQGLNLTADNLRDLSNRIREFVEVIEVGSTSGSPHGKGQVH
jgi:hypothetical protein